MKAEIEKADLERALSAACRIAPKQVTIPTLGHVFMEAVGDSLCVQATDLELSLRTSVPARVQSPGKALVLAKRFWDYTRALEDSAVTLSVGESRWLTIVCGGAKSRLAGMDPEVFPLPPTAPDAQTPVVMNAGKLLAMIRRTMFCVPSKEQKGILKAAEFRSDGSSITLTAVESSRAARISAPIATEKFCLMIPRATLQELTWLLAAQERDVAINWDDNHAFFSVGETALAGRLMAGRNADINRILQQKRPHSASIDRSRLQRLLERTAQFYASTIPRARFLFKGTTLTVSASDSLSGEFEEVVQVEGDADVDLYLNPSYVLDSLKAMDGESSITIYMGGPHDAVHLKDSSEEAYDYVLAPMHA